MNCINCGSEVTGRFCVQCGQSNPPRRLTFRHLFEDFQASMFGFDGMLLRTLKDLTIHPGKVAQRFLEGNRVLYYKPISYFLLVITVMLLVAGLLGVDYFDYMKATADAAVDPAAHQAQNKMSNSMLESVNENLRLFSFVMIPIQAFFSRYLFFRKSGYNFIEHCVLPFYIWGHLYVTTILSIVYFKFTGNTVSLLFTTLLYVLYFGYAFLDLYRYQSRVKAFFKGIGVYLALYLLIIIIAVISGIVIAIVNPELAKEFGRGRS